MSTQNKKSVYYTQVKEYEIEFFNKMVGDKIQDHCFNAFVRINILNSRIEFKGLTLDCGCGNGNIGIYLAKSFIINPIGVDISSHAVDLARKNGYNARCADMEDIKLFPEKNFDNIICFNFLHHFPDIKFIWHNLHSWLKPGGYLLLFEPNGSNLVNKASQSLRKLIEIVYGKQYIIDAKISTPNETNHNLRIYFKYINDYGYRIVYQKEYFTFFGDIRVWLKNSLRKLIPDSHFSKNNIFFILKRS